MTTTQKKGESEASAKKSHTDSNNSSSTSISFHCQKRTQCLALLFVNLAIRWRRFVHIVCCTPSQTAHSLYRHTHTHRERECFWHCGNENRRTGERNDAKSMRAAAVVIVVETEFITFVLVEKKQASRNHSATHVDSGSTKCSLCIFVPIRYAKYEQKSHIRRNENRKENKQNPKWLNVDQWMFNEVPFPFSWWI